VPEDLKQVRQHLQMSMKDKKYGEMFKVRLHEHKIKKNCVDIWTPLIDHKKIERDEPFLFEIAPDRKKEKEDIIIIRTQENERSESHLPGPAP